MANQDRVYSTEELGDPLPLGRTHGAEDPIEFSVWPGHISIQRDVHAQTDFSHDVLLSFVSQMLLALCKQKQPTLLKNNRSLTLFFRGGENQPSLCVGSLLSSESSVKLK